MDHLLRTMASISPEARVLCLGDETGLSAAQLAKLGFDVWVAATAEAVVRPALEPIVGRDEAQRRVSAVAFDSLPYPDTSFDWVAAFLPPNASDAILFEIHRVLKQGSWVWVAMQDTEPDALNGLARGTELAVAETVVAVQVDSQAFARGIFRRVDGDVQS